MTKILGLVLSLLLFTDAFAGLGYSRQRVHPIMTRSVDKAKSFNGAHLLVNIYLSSLQGPQDIRFEVINNDQYTLGLLEFDFSTLSNRGRLGFGDIAPGGKAYTLVKVNNINSANVGAVSIFDQDANERFTKVIVQYIFPSVKATTKSNTALVKP